MQAHAPLEERPLSKRTPPARPAATSLFRFVVPRGRCQRRGAATGYRLATQLRARFFVQSCETQTWHGFGLREDRGPAASLSRLATTSQDIGARWYRGEHSPRGLQQARYDEMWKAVRHWPHRPSRGDIDLLRGSIAARGSRSGRSGFGQVLSSGRRAH
jgi:hypothetical protein